ncbi:hypothetical protein [Desulfonema magnum]|uniref:TRASH domain-containing protein n=1 Tax=Desulfonema magnum TaxID=45655 RepID=A0A975BP91_9BACT|nr:hypothetical protein [Desulfonema magnum]QTA88570.1 TRASH domain-containing protein [Desulfonema magnum]
MIKLLIFLGVLYFGYRQVKSWVVKNVLSGKIFSDQVSNRVDDVMVKDPFCEIYFPKREGVHLRVGEEDLYFCSTECRDKFIESRSKKQ